MGTQELRCLAPSWHKLRVIRIFGGRGMTGKDGDSQGGAMLLYEGWVQYWAQRHGWAETQ